MGIVSCRSLCNIIYENTAFTYFHGQCTIAIYPLNIMIPFLTAVKKCRILNVSIASNGHLKFLIMSYRPSTESVHT